MYFMLDGRLPFDSVFSDEIYENTVGLLYDTDSLHWKNISKAAKDLLSRFLTTQNKRISLAEAAKHPWIIECEDLKNIQGLNRKNRYI